MKSNPVIIRKYKLKGFRYCRTILTGMNNIIEGKAVSTWLEGYSDGPAFGNLLATDAFTERDIPTGADETRTGDEITIQFPFGCNFSKCTWYIFHAPFQILEKGVQ
jgi:hypothetical protein